MLPELPESYAINEYLMLINIIENIIDDDEDQDDDDEEDEDADPYADQEGKLTAYSIPQLAGRAFLSL